MSSNPLDFINLLFENGVKGLGWLLVISGLFFLFTSTVKGKIPLLNIEIESKKLSKVGGYLLLSGILVTIAASTFLHPNTDSKNYCVIGVPPNDPDGGLVVHKTPSLSKETKVGLLAYDDKDIKFSGKCEKSGNPQKFWCFVRGKNISDSKTINGWVNAQDYLENCK